MTLLQSPAPCTGSRPHVGRNTRAPAEVGKASRGAYGLEPCRRRHLRVAATWSL